MQRSIKSIITFKICRSKARSVSLLVGLGLLLETERAALVVVVATAEDEEEDFVTVLDFLFLDEAFAVDSPQAANGEIALLDLPSPPADVEPDDFGIA